MFSNGTEAMIWIGNNCDKCWKQSHYNEDKDRWSNDKCSIDRDIQSQRAGMDEIYERSYTMVKNNTFNGINLPSIVLRTRDGLCRTVRSFGYEDFKTRLS